LYTIQTEEQKAKRLAREAAKAKKLEEQARKEEEKTKKEQAKAKSAAMFQGFFKPSVSSSSGAAAGPSKAAERRRSTSRDSREWQVTANGAEVAMLISRADRPNR
jgi:hypothetical protein